MKSRLWLLVAGGLLASCGLLPGVGGPQVLGSFTGDWTGVNQSKTRLALVGIGQGGVPTYDNQTEIKNITQLKSYILELPQKANEGAYRVYAYCDANANSKIDNGEAISDSGNKYLLYSNSDGSKTFFFVGGSVATTLTVKKGWNGYDSSNASNVPFQGESFPDYNLSQPAAGACQ